MRIQASRLTAHLKALGRFGAVPGNGVTRPAYSAAYREGADYVKSLMTAAGLSVETDPIGNLIGTYQGRTNRILLMGSHIDSVPNGGIFDGCLGVIAAIEAVQTLREQRVELEHTVKIAAWMEEEGNQVTGVLGSRSFVGCAGHLPEETLAKLAAAGRSQADIQASRFPHLDQIDAALELHIEQGGILENERIEIGVVSGIVGIRRYVATIYGKKNHAGTTPMHLRDDAMVKAARLITELDELARATDPDMVCTVGWLHAFPGVCNVIAERVELSVEIRAMEEASLFQVQEHLQTRLAPGELTVRQIFGQQPIRMSPRCKAAISASAAALHLSQKEVQSGAGHDTMALAAQIPHCGMLFVPSVGGLSHCPQELTRWEDAANGTNTLLGALLHLDAAGTPSDTCGTSP